MSSQQTDTVVSNLRDKYNALIEARENEAVIMLRVRADMAEAIAECHKAGLSNYRMAQLLETDRTAIARMSRGIWLPPGVKVADSAPLLAAAGRSEVAGTEGPGTASGSAEGDTAAEDWRIVPRPKLVCRYCSDQAAYVLTMADGKSIMVCRKHKPKEQ